MTSGHVCELIEALLVHEASSQRSQGEAPFRSSLKRVGVSETFRYVFDSRQPTGSISLHSKLARDAGTVLATHRLQDKATVFCFCANINLHLPSFREVERAYCTRFLGTRMSPIYEASQCKNAFRFYRIIPFVTSRRRYLRLSMFLRAFCMSSCLISFTGFVEGVASITPFSELHTCGSLRRLKVFVVE